MAKKEMSGEKCDMCGCMKWYKVIAGLVLAILGLLLIWPKSWFTFNHTFGLLVFLLGLKIIWHGFSGCYGHHCCH